MHRRAEDRMNEDVALRDAERAYVARPDRAGEVRLSVLRARRAGIPACVVCSTTGWLERDIPQRDIRGVLQSIHQRLPCPVCSPKAFTEFRCPSLLAFDAAQEAALDRARCETGLVSEGDLLRFLAKGERPAAPRPAGRHR